MHKKHPTVIAKAQYSRHAPLRQILSVSFTPNSLICLYLDWTFKPQHFENAIDWCIFTWCRWVVLNGIFRTRLKQSAVKIVCPKWNALHNSVACVERYASRPWWYSAGEKLRLIMKTSILSKSFESTTKNWIVISPCIQLKKDTSKMVN